MQTDLYYIRNHLQCAPCCPMRSPADFVESIPSFMRSCAQRKGQTLTKDASNVRAREVEISLIKLRTYSQAKKKKEKKKLVMNPERCSCTWSALIIWLNYPSLYLSLGDVDFYLSIATNCHLMTLSWVYFCSTSIISERSVIKVSTWNRKKLLKLVVYPTIVHFINFWSGE